jgi:urease accessory protein
VVDLCATAPLAAKVRATALGPEVMIVGSAASLLEGDELRVSLRLGAGSRLTVTSVAAQIAHPCPGGGSTAVVVDVEVGAGATLWWRPEPTLVCADGRHHSTATVRLAADGRITWLDEAVLGRSGEDPTDAHLSSALIVDHDGRPLLRDGLDTRARGARGPAVLGPGVRYVGAMHAWGHRLPAAPDGGALVVDLAGVGSLRRVLATDPSHGRAALGR